MQGEPGTMQLAPSYRDVVAEVRGFLDERVRVLLDHGVARQLDEAWGINHSFLFFEVYGVVGNFNASLNTGTPLDWAAGLGFTF